MGRSGLDTLAVDACALCPLGLRFIVALALGVLGVRASFMWLLGSAVFPSAGIRGGSPGLCWAGRLTSGLFIPCLEVGCGMEGPATQGQKGMGVHFLTVGVA